MPSSTTPEMDRTMAVLLSEGTVTISTSRLTACIHAIKAANGGYFLYLTRMAADRRGVRGRVRVVPSGRADLCLRRGRSCAVTGSTLSIHSYGRGIGGGAGAVTPQPGAVTPKAPGARKAVTP
ncbi:hypothetical protein GCM10010252_48340 [Streptomyces aureoverticillatus]|nr:hypothetical protein GCM10010252_48340 [Streptomyces aureoverticillatus]